MQIRQRMEVDNHEELKNAFNPTKPSLKSSQLNSKKLNGCANLKPRTFGQDLTNKERANQNQQPNLPKKFNKKDDGYNFQKKLSQPQQQKLKIEVIQRSQSVSSINPDASTKGNKLYSSMDDIQELHDSKEDMDEDGEIDVKSEQKNAQDEDGDDVMNTFKEINVPIIHPWDCKDSNNDLAVIDYVDEIMDGLKQDEISSTKNYVIKANFDFMKHQKDINSRMRLVLIDWLIEVHRKFKLIPATYYLAINLLDRYLAAQQLNRHQLQLTGCTCLWIASKYHEIYAPEMDDFVYISDSAFGDSELMKMEIDILKTLEFNLTVPTVLSFIERYKKIAEYYLKKEREIKIISSLMMYIIEHCVVNYEICRFLPSKLAASAFVYSCISTKVFSVDTFKNDNISDVIGYDLSELTDVMVKIDSILKNAKKSKHKAVYKKYCSSTYSNIAKLNFNKLNTGFLKIKA